VARRRRDASGPVEPDGRDVDRDYRRLRWFLAASEPGGTAAAQHALIAAEASRLDAAGAPVAQRLAALKDFLAGIGLVDAARRFLCHLDALQLGAGARLDATGGASREVMAPAARRASVPSTTIHDPEE